MATAGPILNQTYVECDGCEDEVDVEWYCLSCKSNLCGKCKTARLHRKHTIKAWMDPAAVSARQDAPMPCDIHPDKTYVNYCTECSVLCCSTCNAGDHCGHKSKTIEDIFDERLSDMKKFIEELKGDCMPLAVGKKEKLIKGVEKCKFECQLNKQKIKQRIDSLRKDLTDMEVKLMKEEETKTKENVEKLQKELLLVEQTEKNIAKAVTDMEKEISISNRQSIILKSLSFSTLGEYKVSEIDDIPDREFKKSDFKFPSAAETVGLSAESGESMMKPAYIPRLEFEEYSFFEETFPEKIILTKDAALPERGLRKQSGKPWICEICRFNNHSRNSSCEMCGYVKVTAATSYSSKWISHK